MDYILISDKLPAKGIDIIGIDKDNETHFCFRCACSRPNCREWRCSLTGFGLMIDVVKWKYDGGEKVTKSIDLNFNELL